MSSSRPAGRESAASSRPAIAGRGCTKFSCRARAMSRWALVDALKLLGLGLRLLEQVLALFLGSLALGDVLEDRHEVLRLRAVDGNREPDAQRLEIGLKGFRLAALRHAPIDLEELRIVLADAGDDLADLATDRALESGQPLKSGVDVEIDEVGRGAVLVEHPTVGVAIDHVLEKRAVALLALAYLGRGTVAVTDVAHDARAAPSRRRCRSCPASSPRRERPSRRPVCAAFRRGCPSRLRPPSGRAPKVRSPVL